MNYEKMEDSHKKYISLLKWPFLITITIFLVSFCLSTLAEGYQFTQDKLYRYIEKRNQESGFVYAGEPWEFMQTWDSDEYDTLRITIEIYGETSSAEPKKVVLELPYSSTGLYNLYLPTGEQEWAYAQEVKDGIAGEKNYIYLPTAIQVRDDLELVGYPDIIKLNHSFDPGVNTKDYTWGFVHYSDSAKCSIDSEILPTHEHTYTEFNYRPWQYVWAGLMINGEWWSTRPKLISVVPEDYSCPPHNLIRIDRVPPTEKTAGTAEYWQCSLCEKLYSDENATNEIEAAPVILPVYTSSVILPINLKEIEDEAFENLPCEAVIVPRGCTHIGHYAFRNCKYLKYIKVPAAIEIEPDAFEGCGDFVIDRIR